MRFGRERRDTCTDGSATAPGDESLDKRVLALHDGLDRAIAAFEKVGRALGVLKG